MKRQPAQQDALDLNCTIAGATGSATTDGQAIIVSTSDDPFTTRTRLVTVAPTDGFKFVATQIQTLPGNQVVEFHDMHTRGVNDQGFAYTWSGAPPSPDFEPDFSTAYGIPFPQFGRLLLSRARNVGDAISILESNPRAIHGNFLFADARGEVALVEVSTLSLQVETRTRDGWLGRSNHWVSPQMADKGRPSGEESSSAVRLKRIHELMKEGNGRIDVDYLSSSYRDHATLEDTGWSVCAHGHTLSSDGTRSGTVSSEILEPSKRTIHYCFGWPCGGQVEYPDQQIYQDRSWGQYLAFRLDDMEPGEYVTVDGRLTPLAIRYMARTGTRQVGVPQPA